MSNQRETFLNPSRRVRPIDVEALPGLDALVDQMGGTSFQARNLARARDLLEEALREEDCSIFLCLAGSLVSAGLGKVLTTLVEHNMVDAIVSTGANIVDQDFFEGLGFSHYQGDPMVDDNLLRELHIDRIYDHFIDEDELKVCDATIARILDGLDPRPYSSRELIWEMGRYLAEKGARHDGLVETCYHKDVPIFCPAFADCSAGFGFVAHQHARRKKGEPMVTLDGARDFLELTYLKMDGGKESAIFMIGGGVPKNFIQDTVVAGEILGREELPMHKYAVQLTVADERDGALSGSTLREASSWGKVSTSKEQMVYGEASVTLPLLAGALYHGRAWEGRRARRFQRGFGPDGGFERSRCAEAMEAH
ncbi:MAG TPA: deoxyhypusine synthase [Planctomycetes bacterium]|nr:deoxyhypusine synthase [Planctomycetota bacterium]